MKTFKDKIIQAQLIYKSQSTDSALRAWPLKKTKCEVFCYEVGELGQTAKEVMG